MSGVASLTEFGWKTFLQLVDLKGAAAGVFFSPCSLYVALVLLLNGTGPCYRPDEIRSFTPVLYNGFQALVGPKSQTQKELLELLKQQDSCPADSNPDTEASLNEAVAALQRSLQIEAGNGSELLIANALWTKETPLQQAYQTSMAKLFEV
jgi:serine protease inhibitor